MSVPNMNVLTELSMIVRRDFPVLPANVINPTNGRALVDGEWLQLDANYNAVRGGTNNGVYATTLAPSFAVHTEKGRYDMQALGKATLLYMRDYEAQTLIYNPTGLVVGSLLVVQDVLIGGVYYRGLKLSTGAGTDWVVATCVKPVDGSGYMRFRTISGFLN